ncbi:MAG: AAA family ATPase [Peptoniphilus sp.]|nr:AAA family ATPase [Peptoniphilus sp.]MDY3119153.1 AAA family ATPase [Peptoniphilus sp.]
MNFIEKIILVNFQSHAYSELSLSRGVNVIVGPSDSGKTAIMRALRWNMFNDPSGVEFVREGEKEVSVTVQFQNHVEVERRRSQSKNQYILRRPNEEELIFEGFGKNVPKEIEDAIGIKKVMLDDKKSLPLNFSDQLDGPFLLQETDAYKAQAIGRMVGVDILDETMRDTLRDKKQISIRRELMEKDLEETKHSLDAFSDLDQKIAIREKTQVILSRVAMLKEQLQSARDVQYRLKALKDTRLKTDALLKKYAVVNKLKDSLHHLQTEIDRYGHERMLLDFYRRNTDSRGEVEGVLTYYKNLQALEDIVTRLGEIRGIYNQVLPLVKKRQSSQEAIDANVSVLQETKNIHSIDAMRLEEKYRQLSSYLQWFEASRELIQRIKVGRIFLSRYEPLDSMQEKNDRITALVEKDKAIRSLLQGQKQLIQNKKNLAFELQRFVDEEKKAMHAYLDSLSQAGSCPLCKQSIDEAALHVIRHSLED